MTTTFRCTIHGDTEAWESEDGLLKTCLLCRKQGEKERKREEATRGKDREKDALERKQRDLDRALDNAAIAPRFKDRTFDTFKIENKGQSLAVQRCAWLLHNLGKTTGLIFIGKPGTGKDHLAIATIKEAITTHGKTAIMTEAIKIIRAIKESWGSTVPESEVISRYTVPDLLVINELGVQFGSPTERIYLTEIINDRYNHMKATILIGNLEMKELEVVVGFRAIDRFKEDGHTVAFEWESYRAKG